MTDKSREAFEKHLLSQFPYSHSITSMYAGRYTWPQTNTAWDTWQASRQQALDEAADMAMKYRAVLAAEIRSLK